MQNYKDLKVWEKAHKLTLKVYKVTKVFPKEELYGIVSQLKRSAASMPANIVEGCGRYGKNEFAQFLNVALGSANETEYFLLLARDLDYLPSDEHDELYKDINEIKAMLIALISKVRA